MKACLKLSSLEQWAKKGALVAMPEALTAHLGRCERCAQFAQIVRQARELGQLLPAKAMESARHETVKFHLMAEARRSQRRPRVGVVRTQFSLRSLALAAIVASAAATATATHHYGNAIGSRSATRSTAVDEARSLPHLASRWNRNRHVVVLPSTYTARFYQPGTERVRQALAAQHEPAVESSNDADSDFTLAWGALQAKQPADAAKRFDALLASSIVDASRRADILYWSAQSHRQAGNTTKAKKRSLQLLQQYPNAPFAAAAALMLGEFAMASDQFALALSYLTSASHSPHAVVRERARHALADLAKKP